MTETTLPPDLPSNSFHRLNHAFGPVMAGMIIDAVDLITLGPVGLVVGLPVGACAGYWLGQSLGLDRKASAVCALAAGVYCTIPFTEILPLGTLVGALVRFESTDRSLPAAASSTIPETAPPHRFEDER